MDDQYGMADLRQLMNGGRSYFPPAVSQHIEIFPGYRNLLLPPGEEYHHHQHNLMMIPGSQVSNMMPDFRPDSAANSARVVVEAAAAIPGSAPTLSSGFEVETLSYGGDGGCGRWPRQETLTLLEIRSRLDSKFKEANQKGPLWDEVSRIMSVEYGYQRSGKKCREKFENLYKYYKKTKEGKAGRQDGKHYRFFRQLEALYGQTSNGVSVSEAHLVSNTSFKLQTTQGNQESTNQFPKHSDSLSLSNSSELESSSSDEAHDVAVAGERGTKRRGRKCWKAKIKGFVNSQMRKLVEKQEDWLEKIMKSLEQKENERMMKEEEFRKDEMSRIEREHRFWGKERAWIEARDAALMAAMQNLTGREVIRSYSLHENQNEDESEILNNNGGLTGDDAWRECEMTWLIQLRTEIESGFRQTREQDSMWEEIGAKMACVGYERSGLSCKEKWESINKYVKKNSSGKKRKDDSRGFDYFRDDPGRYNQGGITHGEIKEEEEDQETAKAQINQGSSLNPSTNANHVQDHCFRFLSEEGEFLWENYGTKANNGDKSQ